MAWLVRDWTAGEFITEAIMDQVSANFNEIGPHIRLRKTTDQDVISSTTLVDDTHLTFAIAANEIWILELMLQLNSGTGGHKLQITGPAGSSGISSVFADVTAGSPFGATAAVGAPVYNSAVTTTEEPSWIKATVVNGATPGTCRLQWAQASSVGTNSTIRANSYMLAHRIS